MTDSNASKVDIEHVCFYVPSFGDGGVERMITNIALGMSQAGVLVDFIIHKTGAPFINTLDGRVNFIEPDPSPQRAVGWLADYLKKSKPQIIMTIKDAEGFIAISAKQKSETDTKVIARTGTALKTRFKQRRVNFVKAWYKSRQLRKMYQKADGHIAVAEGTRRELIDLIEVAEQQVILIKNPVITPMLLEQQHAEIDHPWFTEKKTPLILGIGGFRTQKDFTTLISAFALVRKSLAARLVILGQGRQEHRLKKLCADLGIDNDVDFPGFSDNPYAWLNRADLFVLSSLWEGSPNVLTEALAIGTPVVSTDCQSGPREVLQDGKYGELVPLQDPDAMAEAMLRTLETPLLAEFLREAVKDYTLEASTESYLEAFRYFLSQQQAH